MGDKGVEGGVKNLKKWVTSIMDGPLLFPNQIFFSLVAWVVSNCNKVTSNRMEYVSKLKNYIQVDVYGKCGDFQCANHSGIFPCDYKLGTNYKFYLAFENSICVDYVTEKLFNTFLLPIVPVVLGGANYEKYAPKHSYINVAHFASPGHLADYLVYLDKNPVSFVHT